MPHELELIDAIVKSTVDDIEALIAQGADPRKLPSHGLLQAICRSPVGPYEIAPGRTVMAPNSRYRLEVLKCLLEHGADPNAIPLAEACMHGDADVVKLLLDHGANANDRVAMDRILERLPHSTGARQVDWLQKLQLLLRAGLPRDIPAVQQVLREHPWVFQ